MKLTILSFAFLLSFSAIVKAQSISLKDIVQKPTTEFKASVSANQYGGNIVFNRTYRANCTGRYNISWQFNKDLSSLRDGEQFSITISCKNCKTPCGYKWGLANVYASNNVRSIDKYPNYSYNGNIAQMSTTAASSGVHDWSPGHITHTYTFVYHKKKDTPLTAFTFDFAGYRIYYVFEKGTSVSKSVNCHTLFGLGKLIYGLELGAYEGYGWEWMHTTISYALEHIKASNCLDNSYLNDLKRRIYGTSDTKAFLQEIRTYSRKLDTEINTSCGCCATCSD